MITLTLLSPLVLGAPLFNDPAQQLAYIKASNPDALDLFGTALDVDGPLMVVGSSNEDSGVQGSPAYNGLTESGAAYVLRRAGSAWVHEALLKAPNAQENDRFGHAVAISGTTIVVGAFGEDGGSSGVDGDPSDNSRETSGAVYVFVRANGVWNLEAYLKASNPDAGDQFGRSVAIDGDTLVVGAPFEASGATGVDGVQTSNASLWAGAAYVFVRSGNTWTQQAYLKASNTETLDTFGFDVAIDGDTIVVGAQGEDSSATGVGGVQDDEQTEDSGAAYVFERTGTVWAQVAYLKASNTGWFDQFGAAVDVSGDAVIVGAPREDSNATGINGNGQDNTLSRSGAAYVFQRDALGWSQSAYLKASNSGQGDEFGSYVAISGPAALVGAPFEASAATGVDGDQSSNGAAQSGAAYAFVPSGTDWSQLAYLKASNTGLGDQFGTGVALADNIALVGALREDSDAVGVGGDGANNDRSESGAAYLFDLGVGPFGPQWRVVAGCAGNTAQLLPPPLPATLGSQRVVVLATNSFTTGVGLLFAGAKGVDAAGCGIATLDGEVLMALAPFPIHVSTTPILNGTANMLLTLPLQPSLVGAVVTLQGLALASFPGVIELTTGLEFEIQP